MTRRLLAAIAGLGASAALIAGGTSSALAAHPHHRHTHRVTHAASGASSSETALTGATLASASSAALAAVPGATVDRASTETDSTITGAAYEVHVTKSDGSHAVVLEDASFAVLKVPSGTGAGCHGGPESGGGNGETALTGSTLSSASAAALAAVPGGTVDRASTETDSSTAGATYEVHVTKSDGSRVLVIEDASFNVLSTTAEPAHPADGHRSGPGSHGIGDQGTSSNTTRRA